MIKKEKKKKAKRSDLVLNLYEVFDQTANICSGSLSPTCSQHIPLTPLSHEACLKNGINPEVLRKRTFESFSEPSLDPIVQEMRYDAYMLRREQMMKIARTERENVKKNAMIERGIVDAEGNMVASNSAHIESYTSVTDVLEEQQLENSALVEVEKRRLEKAKNKQKKELLQLIQYENEQNRVRKKIQEKKEKEAKKEEIKRREKIKRDRDEAENKRIRELRRKAQEDAEEEIHRIAQQDLREKEKIILKEKERQKEIMKRRARQLEEERNRKREEHKIQAKIRIQQQTEELLRRQDERERRERDRIHRIEMNRKREKLEFEARQREMKNRLKTNQEAARKWQEKRKAELLQKQREADELLKRKQYEQELNRRQKQERLFLETRKKALRLQEAKENEEKRKNMVMKKFECEEEHLSSLHRLKKKKFLIERERRAMQDQLKRENVERIKRMHDYHRSETERKVREGDKRIKEMMKKKRLMIEQRKKAAYEAKRQKDKILDILEQSKTAGGRSMKKILSALSSADGLDGNKTSKSTKTKLKTRSFSAGRLQGPPVESLGPPPYVPSVKKRFAKSADNSDRRFRSPYERSCFK